MFEEVLGIPAHPLIVHAAVVFVPLQALGALVYAFVARWRARITWAVVSLVVLGPLAAWIAKLSGQALRDRFLRNDRITPDFLPRIDEHNSFGDATAWASLALAVVTLLLLLQVRATSSAGGSGAASVVLGWVLRIAVLAGAAASLYYIFRTGDSGAHLVWEGQ